MELNLDYFPDILSRNYTAQKAAFVSVAIPIQAFLSFYLHMVCFSEKNWNNSNVISNEHA